jgi:hypothetical protein
MFLKYSFKFKTSFEFDPKLEGINLITDDNKEEIIINSDNINSIHYNLVKAISKKWMALTGG